MLGYGPFHTIEGAHLQLTKGAVPAWFRVKDFVEDRPDAEK
jgi:hypothetical protein